MKWTVPAKQEVSKNKFSLGTDEDEDEGKYYYLLRASLVHFPDVSSVSTMFTAIINRRPLNRAPFFVKPLSELLTIQMRNYTDDIEAIPWSYELPETADLDGDFVNMSINWWGSESFMSLEGRIIKIRDIREDPKNMLRPGYYPVFITLDDKRISKTYMLPIRALPANPVVNETETFSVSFDEIYFKEMQKKLDRKAYLKWLADLVVRRVICDYEEYLMSFIDTDDPLDWAYK